MGVYSVGQLAKAVGVSADTLRYYEKEGLLTPRRKGAGAYRTYGAEDVRRLSFIRHAQECGCSLREVRSLLSFPEQEAACCNDVRSLAIEKKLQLEGRIQAMKRMSHMLDGLIKACQDEGRGIHDCPILQRLEHEFSDGHRHEG
jgi:DNA-binding transcriptional MerR regulator